MNDTDSSDSDEIPEIVMTVVKDLQNQIRKANRELNDIQIKLSNLENSDKLNAEDSIEQFDTLSQLVTLREKETDLTKKIARLHNDLVNLMDGKSILPEIEPGHNMSEMYDSLNSAKKSSEIREANFEKSEYVKKKSSKKDDRLDRISESPEPASTISITSDSKSTTCIVQ